MRKEIHWTHCVISWSANLFITMMQAMTFYRNIFIRVHCELFHFIFFFINPCIYIFWVFSRIFCLKKTRCVHSIVFMQPLTKPNYHRTILTNIYTYNYHFVRVWILILEFLDLFKTTFKSMFRLRCETVHLINLHNKLWLYCKMKMYVFNFVVLWLTLR